MNDPVAIAYTILTIFEIGIFEIVIRQVDGDRINNIDPQWVRWARRVSFVSAELYLCFTIYAIGWLWQPDPIVLGLIFFGDLILAVNIISLYLRTPRNQGGYRASVTSHPWWRHRRG